MNLPTGLPNCDSAILCGVAFVGLESWYEKPELQANLNARLSL